jgi:butyryl-CoA dehydrogenase/short/branched chain acyl-CoA dehydrogenase
MEVMLPVRLPLTALAEEERLLYETTLEFAEHSVRPLVRSMDEAGAIPAELLRQLFELGLMAVEVPSEYGGAESSFFSAILAVEALARVDASVSVLVDVQNTLFLNTLLRAGTTEQKARYLPLLAREWVGAYALSEAGSGSDAFALRTTATRAEGGWVLHGEKLWITNAAEASLFVVFATVDRSAGHRGITAFLVERETPGLSVGPKEDKLGIRASSTCPVMLEDVRLPDTQLLGAVGLGYREAMATLNEGRVGIGAQMVGIAAAALELATRHVEAREQFGKTVASFQGVQFQLARMRTDLEAARLLVYNAARLRDAGLPFASEAAMAKLRASEVAERLASETIDLLGAVGFMRDFPAEKLLRDAKIGKIYEGTSNMQLLTIARRWLDERA